MVVFLVLLFSSLATPRIHPTGGDLIGLASIGPVLSPSSGRAA
jgi:hypothetical protein